MEMESLIFILNNILCDIITYYREDFPAVYYQLRKLTKICSKFRYTVTKEIECSGMHIKHLMIESVNIKCKNKSKKIITLNRFADLNKQQCELCAEASIGEWFSSVNSMKKRNYVDCMICHNNRFCNNISNRNVCSVCYICSAKGCYNRGNLSFPKHYINTIYCKQCRKDRG